MLKPEYTGNNWFQDKRYLSQFHKDLMAWGTQNFRDFPWRKGNDPYKILIAEIMLHRTQAKQVLKIYGPFIEIYPSIEFLSKVSVEELHDNLYSLGLRWRIDRLYEMVHVLKNNHDMKIPTNRKMLLSLPGVSEYIADAVRCFAWGIPEPLADTNTIRIIGRLFDLDIKASSRRDYKFRNLLTGLLSIEFPRSYNYALLDLADKICTKRLEPDCLLCPIIQFCAYGNEVHREQVIKRHNK